MSQAKVAIIGLGAIGTALANQFIRGNRTVILASHQLSDAETLATQLGDLAVAHSVSDAIDEADIIIFSVWFNTMQELIAKHKDQLKGKIVIDPSNPIAPDENGGFKKIIDANASAGQIIQALLPENTHFVKGFGTLGVEALKNEGFKNPDNVLFYATDEVTVIPTIDTLIQDAGFAPVHIGAVDQSIRLEVFGELHQFGALGKAITITEWNAMSGK